MGRIILLLFIAFIFNRDLTAQIVEPYTACFWDQFVQSRESYQAGLLRTAEDELKAALKYFPANEINGRVVIHYSEIDFYTGNFIEADRNLEKFISEQANSPFTAFAALLRAYFAFHNRNYGQSEKLFTAAKTISEKEYLLRKDSIYADMAHNALFWKANALALQGKYQDAYPVYEECFRKYPGSKYSDDALFALGLISEINQQFENALTYYKTLGYNYPRSNIYIASKIREINDNLILRDPTTALLVIEKTDADIKHILMKDSVGLLLPAQDYADKAQEEILYLKGEAYNLAGNYDQALTALIAFIETFSESELIHYVNLGAGWAYLNKGDYTEAQKYYNNIIKSGIQDKDIRIKALALLYKATAIKRSGDTALAQKEFSNLAVQADFPFLAQALLELGQIYYENKEFENATRSLERAERESNDALTTVKIYLLLGASYLELRRWDKSVMAYKAGEQLALKGTPSTMPQKDWYVAESRLKQGIGLIRAMRNADAIPPLLAFIGDYKKDERAETALFWLAEAYYRSDLLNNAIEKYQNLLSLYPKSVYREETYYGLGWSYFRIKNFDKSSEVFALMLAEFPDSKFGVEVLSRQGDGYYITRNYQKAFETYDRAAKLSPNTEEGQYSSYQLCHALYRMGKYEDAITSLLNFVRKYPKAAYASHALYLTGWIRFQQKKYNEATDDFRFLIQAYPQSNLVPRAYFAIGDAQYNQGSYEKAIEAYKTIFESYPSSSLAPEAIRSIQYCYIALGNNDEAMKIADRFIESNPGSPFAADFIFKKGEIFYTGKNYKDAVTEYESFIKKYPDSEKNAEALYWMAKSYFNLGEPDKADQAYNELLKKYPKTDFAPQSLLERAIIKKQGNNIASADSLFRYVQDKYPEHQGAAQAGFERAAMKFSMGDTAAAINLFSQVAEKYNGMDYSDQSIYRIAMYQKMRGELDSSMMEFGKLINNINNPGLASEANYRIGEIQLRKGNTEEAIKYFRIVRDKYQGYEDWFSLSLLNLGDCYERLGNTEGAAEVYQALIALRPDDDFGKTAKRRQKQIEKK